MEFQWITIPTGGGFNSLLQKNEINEIIKKYSQNCYIFELKIKSIYYQRFFCLYTPLYIILMQFVIPQQYFIYKKLAKLQKKYITEIFHHWSSSIILQIDENANRIPLSSSFRLNKLHDRYRNSWDKVFSNKLQNNVLKILKIEMNESLTEFDKKWQSEYPKVKKCMSFPLSQMGVEIFPPIKLQGTISKSFASRRWGVFNRILADWSKF